MEILLTVIAFIVVFGVLILVHEIGHFFAARKAGIRVEEFGFGLPPRLFGIKKGETIYSINCIPFGGFVRMYGEDGFDDKLIKSEHSFIGKSLGARTCVIVAGVAMNFVLAIALLTIGFSVGMVPFPGSPEFNDAVTVEAVVVNSVLSGGSAEGKLKAGDEILMVGKRKVDSVATVVGVTGANTLRPIHFLVRREEAELVFPLVPNQDGKVGIEITEKINAKPLQLMLHKAFIISLRETWRLSKFTLVALGGFIRHIASRAAIPQNVAGPVGIVEMTHDIVKLGGIMPLIKFIALLSISLGVINIMPFPALDGGRFLFILVELVRRKRANAKIESIVHMVGFAILLLLLVAITWNDIARIVAG